MYNVHEVLQIRQNGKCFNLQSDTNKEIVKDKEAIQLDLTSLQTGQGKCLLCPTCICRQRRQKLWRQGKTRGFLKCNWQIGQFRDWSVAPPTLSFVISLSIGPGVRFEPDPGREAPMGDETNDMLSLLKNVLFSTLRAWYVRTFVLHVTSIRLRFYLQT